MTSRRILGVIPARGGSKGVLRKNLALLAGRPLIAHAVATAAASRMLIRTIVSTEDEEIITVARRLGADVPFIRPTELATDAATAGQVARHALETIEAVEGQRYDYLCLLEPTSPLRTTDDIDRAIGELLRSDAEAVVSVVKIEAPHPVKTLMISNGQLRPFIPERWRPGLNRQELEPVYAVNGAIYCAVRRLLVAQESFWGANTIPYIMPPERSINIDTEFDLQFAEFILERGSGTKTSIVGVTGNQVTNQRAHRPKRCK